jgi:hypothetical protein
MTIKLFDGVVKVVMLNESLPGSESLSAASALTRIGHGANSNNSQRPTPDLEGPPHSSRAILWAALTMTFKTGND